MFWLEEIFLLLRFVMNAKINGNQLKRKVLLLLGMWKISPNFKWMLNSHLSLTKGAITILKQVCAFVLVSPGNQRVILVAKFIYSNNFQ